jgi:hypothetical protein
MQTADRTVSVHRQREWDVRREEKWYGKPSEFAAMCSEQTRRLRRDSPTEQGLCDNTVQASTPA